MTISPQQPASSSLEDPLERSEVLRATILELSARWDATERSLEEVDELLSASSSRAPGSDLVVVPELSFTGYVSPDLKFDLTPLAEPIDGRTIRSSSALARKHRTHLVVPLVLAEGERVHNASIVLAPSGEVIATYRKRHPWFPERWAAPGKNAMPLFDVCGYNVTIAICYDAHFIAHDSPEILARADILTFPSAWVDEDDSRLPLLRRLARTFDLAIVNANWGEGDPDGHLQIPGQGRSVILDRDGRVQAEVVPPHRRADAILEKRG